MAAAKSRKGLKPCRAVCPSRASSRVPFASASSTVLGLGCDGTAHQSMHDSISAMPWRGGGWGSRRGRPRGLDDGIVCLVHLMGLDNRPISLPPPWAFSPPTNPRVRPPWSARRSGAGVSICSGRLDAQGSVIQRTTVVRLSRTSATSPFSYPRWMCRATAREWVDDLTPLYRPTASRWLAVIDRTTPSLKARHVVPDSGRRRPGVIRRQQTRSPFRREGRRTTGLLVDVLMRTRVLMTTGWPSTTIRREAKVTEVDCPHDRSTCRVALLDWQRPVGVRHFRYGHTDRPGSRVGRGTFRGCRVSLERYGAASGGRRGESGRPSPRSRQPRPDRRRRCSTAGPVD